MASRADEVEAVIQALMALGDQYEMPMTVSRVLGEAAHLLREDRYPYKDGDVLVLGPEVFADGAVVCWQGVNYYREEEPNRCAPLMEAIERVVASGYSATSFVALEEALRAHREQEAERG